VETHHTCKTLKINFGVQVKKAATIT